MTLTVISFVIVLLTFLFKEILKNRLQELRDGVSSAQNLFHNDSNHSLLRLQLAEMETAWRAEKNKAAVAKAKRTQNFSKIIKADLASMVKRRNELRQKEESTEKLLKPLPRGARELRNAFEKLKEEVKRVTDASIQTEKSLSGEDWAASSMVKLKIIELAFTEIQVALLGDKVLTYATTVQEAAEKLYRLCNRISYVLYVLGISLGLYANLAGIKHIVGME